MSDLLEISLLYGFIVETGTYFGEIWLLYIYLRIIGDFNLNINSEKRKIIRILAILLLIAGVSTRTVVLVLLFIKTVFSFSYAHFIYILGLVSYLPLLFSMLFVIYLFLIGTIRLDFSKKALIAVNVYLAIGGAILYGICDLSATALSAKASFLFLVIVLSLNASGITSIAIMFWKVILKVELYKYVTPVTYKAGIILLLLFNELLLGFFLAHIITSPNYCIYLIPLQLSYLGYAAGVALISFSITATYDYLKRGGTI